MRPHGSSRVGRRAAHRRLQLKQQKPAAPPLPSKTPPPSKVSSTASETPSPLDAPWSHWLAKIFESSDSLLETEKAKTVGTTNSASPATQLVDKQEEAELQSPGVPMRGALQWLGSLMPPSQQQRSMNPLQHNNRHHNNIPDTQIQSSAVTPSSCLSSRRVRATLIRSNRHAVTKAQSRTSTMETLAFAPGACQVMPMPEWPIMEESAALGASPSCFGSSISASTTHDRKPMKISSGCPSATTADELPKSVCFFDLDDTLIPTEWVRRAYVVARAQLEEEASNSRVGEDAFGCDDLEGNAPSDVMRAVMERAILQRVRRYMDASNSNLEAEAIRVLTEAMTAFGVVVLVTNARSITWLRLVEKLFPMLRSQMRQLGIPIVKAALDIGADTCRTFSNVSEYFDYWSGLKQTQFSRVVEEVVSNRGLESLPEQGVTSVQWLLTQAENSILSACTLRKVIDFQLWNFACNQQILQAQKGTICTTRRPLCRGQSFSTSSSTSTTVTLLRHSNNQDEEEERQESGSVEATGSTSLPLHGKVNVISIGDSEFELVAARRLAIEDLTRIRGLGLMRCKAGLPPDMFCQQLRDLQKGIRWFDQQQHIERRLDNAPQKDPRTTSLRRSHAQPENMLHVGKHVVAEWTDRKVAFVTQTLGSHLI